MKRIEAKIVADSKNEQGDRIITYLLTYPRFIHSELMTHRVFSRNSASSRAIPFEKMVKMVEEDPFIPIAWQKDHKGMQGTEYISSEDGVYVCSRGWLEARDNAIKQANWMHSCNVTKQLCNRLLEPFMWYTTLVTATEFSGFFELRCPKIYHAADGNYYKSVKDWNSVDKDIQYKGLSCLHPENTSQAEIHIQALAESMWDAQNESVPKELKAGEWHIPFGDRILIPWKEGSNLESNTKEAIKIATARCARLSYMTFDGEIDYEKDIQLHDRLLASHHMSPFEHCARVMSVNEYNSFIKGEIRKTFNGGPEGDTYQIPSITQGWCNNFKGFIQYRYLIENNETQ